MNGNKGELESRPRVMTEKGLIYSLEQKLKVRQSCYRKLSNLSDDVNELLSENPDKEKVKNVYKKWMQNFEELIVLHKDYQKLLSSSPTEQTTDDEEFQAKCDRFKTVKDSVEVWMLRHVTSDDKSVRSKLTCSSKSSSSRLSMEKLKEQQRKAELIARASALSQRRELEEAKLRLKLKEEELEIKTEIEITDAKTKIIEELEKSVLQDLEIEESLQNNDHCVRANHPERKQTATVTLNPDALPWEDQRNNAHPTVTTKMCQSRNTPVHIS